MSDRYLREHALTFFNDLRFAARSLAQAKGLTICGAGSQPAAATLVAWSDDVKRSASALIGRCTPAVPGSECAS